MAKFWSRKSKKSIFFQKTSPFFPQGAAIVPSYLAFSFKSYERIWRNWPKWPFLSQEGHFLHILGPKRRKQDFSRGNFLANF